MKISKVIHSLDSRIRDDSLLLSLSVAKLVCAIVILAHLCACTWYAVGNESEGWVYLEGIEDKTFGDRYLYSFQWSLARLHPSNMSENMDLLLFSERILAVLSTIIAMFVLSIFISTMTNTMAEIKKHRQQRGRKVELTRAYCREHRISKNLVLRVRQYIESHHSSRSRLAAGHYDAELTTMLPISLLMDLRHEAWSPVILRMDFFRTLHKTHRTTERDICHQALQEVPVFAGDTVFTTGDACSRMLFVVKATLSYTLGMVMGQNAQDSTSVTVPSGQWVSEAVLWTVWENCGQLSSSTDATLLGILVEPFMKVMRSHEHALIEAAIYAKSFVEVLNSTEKDELSDLDQTTRQPDRTHSDLDADSEPTQSFTDLATFRNWKRLVTEQPVVAWELSTAANSHY